MSGKTSSLGARSGSRLSAPAGSGEPGRARLMAEAVLALVFDMDGTLIDSTREATSEDNGRTSPHSMTTPTRLSSTRAFKRCLVPRGEQRERVPSGPPHVADLRTGVQDHES